MDCNFSCAVCRAYIANLTIKLGLKITSTNIEHFLQQDCSCILVWLTQSCAHTIARKHLWMCGENIVFVKVNITVNDKDLATNKKTKQSDSAVASRTLEVNM